MNELTDENIIKPTRDNFGDDFDNLFECHFRTMTQLEPAEKGTPKPAIREIKEIEVKIN